MSDAGERVAIRLDVTQQIGSGHAMRCMSIADSLASLGASAVFLVSCEESAEFLLERGANVFILSGNAQRLGEQDALALIEYCNRADVNGLLVDTYGAGERFHQTLCANSGGWKTALIDDMYTFESGIQSVPQRFQYDVIINYDFNATSRGYETVYCARRTNCLRTPELLLGPTYAPLRPIFRERRISNLRTEVQRVLITSGSTNPERYLERMTRAVLDASEGTSIEIEVIVGPLASYSIELKDVECSRVHTRANVKDLSGYMQASDLVISAGGSTLYELACIGTPTVAVPIVPNQMQNVQGFVKLGLGLGVDLAGQGQEALVRCVQSLLEDAALRSSLSRAAQDSVDGNGAERIACKLL